MARDGLLLLNLGTPSAPDADAVGPYLREFLMDPFVVDIPWLSRWILVNLLIVPKRSHASAALYRRIWTDRGSPLAFHTEDLSRKVLLQLERTHSVRWAMRYGEPSIEDALKAFRDEGVAKVTVLPLYPQYSMAASQSSVDRVMALCKQVHLTVPVDFVPPFYDDEAYLDAVEKVSRPALEERKHDAVLFSFHGLPERQVKRTDLRGDHCLRRDDCCDRIVEANELCYRAQCYATARALAARLVPQGKPWFVGFQSRLGRTPWIRPYSDEYYRTLPKQGIERLAVVSPSFVADCLETLEEVALRGSEEFVHNGGSDLFLVPSLNSHDAWVDAVVKLVKRSGPWPAPIPLHAKTRLAKQGTVETLRAFRAARTGLFS